MASKRTQKYFVKPNTYKKLVLLMMQQTSYSDTLHSECYSRINFTKSPASGTGNISQPTLMSQARTVG
jgi:hypothetical protein